jgi:hypothetical protein
MVKMRRRARRVAESRSDREAATLDEFEGRENIADLAWWGYQSVKVIGGILLVFFAWLQLKSVPLGTIVQNTTPEILIKATLVLYYACWVGGATFDTWVQQRVFVADPKRGKLTLDLFAVMAGFFVVAFALVWASLHQELFVLVLLVFVIANFAGWNLIVRRIRPTISSSEKVLFEGGYLFRFRTTPKGRGLHDGKLATSPICRHGRHNHCTNP